MVALPLMTQFEFVLIVLCVLCQQKNFGSHFGYDKVQVIPNKPIKRDELKEDCIYLQVVAVDPYLTESQHSSRPTSFDRYHNIGTTVAPSYQYVQVCVWSKWPNLTSDALIRFLCLFYAIHQGWKSARRDRRTVPAQNYPQDRTAFSSFQ